MVRPLQPPTRPIAGGTTWTWQWPATPPPTRSSTTRPWGWCRVYHRSTHTPDGHTPRTFGPLSRFDQHSPAPTNPTEDPDSRSVLYVGADLATSACEVFGEARVALLCPNIRVALLRPRSPLTCFDLLKPGAAMAIGALPSLSDAPCPRVLTQHWARAIYEDRPTGQALDGIRYRSAYNGGESLALWDSTGQIDTINRAIDSDTHEVQDFTLTEPRILRTLLATLPARGITIDIISSATCPTCP